MPDVKVITLPWPDEDIRSNSRANRVVKTRKVKSARNYAWAVAMEAPRIQKMPDATIFVEYYPKAYREDIHNVPFGLKAYIDGIADAMGCDDKRFTVDYPSVWAGRSNPGKVVFRVVPPVVEVPVIGEIS